MNMSLFSGPSPEEQKKLYRKSHNISAIAIFTGLFAAIFLVIGIFTVANPLEHGLTPGESIGYFFGYLVFSTFYALTMVGLLRRTSWGRTLGIIAWLPLAVGLIGIYIVWVLFTSSEFFGANRITHKELLKTLKNE